MHPTNRRSSYVADLLALAEETGGVRLRQQLLDTPLSRWTQKLREAAGFFGQARRPRTIAVDDRLTVVAA